MPLRVVAMLEKNGILKIANVGDCGVRIIRKGENSIDSVVFLGFLFLISEFVCLIVGQIVYSTSPQEHYFDCPYQLSSEAVGQTFIDATVLNPIHHMNFS